MSIEAVGEGSSGEIIELFGPEAAIRKHWQLHAEIGRLSIQLNEISTRYHQAIAETIENKTALREYGVDTDELARQTIAALNPQSAINGYGRGQD